MYSPFSFMMHLLSLAEKLLSFCLGTSAARDDAERLSRSMATGFEEVLELVPKQVSLLTLAAIAQIRLSLLLSSLKDIHR